MKRIALRLGALLVAMGRCLVEWASRDENHNYKRR